MGILEELIAEYAANKMAQEAIAAERLYLTKMIELINKVLAAKEAGLSFEALEKAEMYLSEQAYRMEVEEADRIEMETEHTDEEDHSWFGNEKLHAGDVSLYPQLRKEV
tara:strand:+ start:861 stop:1187 length:327 start_codon:yes stop_codon:yes gene_type:complete